MVTFADTPEHELSFSGLVDEILRQAGRYDRLLDVISHLNSTIRECQAFGVTPNDLYEDQVTIDVEPFVWTYPKRLRFLLTAQYENTKDYPKFLRPGKQQQGEDCYYYKATDYYIFKGTQGVGDKLNVAYYRYGARHKYYLRYGQDSSKVPGDATYTVRPAYFDPEGEVWYYLNAEEDGYVTTLGDTAEETLRQENVSNWIILKWKDMLMQGAQAKLFHSVGDQDRSRTAFAIYKQQQDLFLKEEAVESIGA